MLRKLDTPVVVSTDLGDFTATHRQFRFNYDGEVVTSISILGFVLDKKFRALATTAEQYQLVADDLEKIDVDVERVDFSALADLHIVRRDEVMKQRAEDEQRQADAEAELVALNEAQAAASIAAENEREKITAEKPAEPVKK